ncbi:peptide chain release factor 1 [bacterium]|nr:peptide chain release factor 1 [bacterium]
MFQKLDRVLKKFGELTELLADPNIYSDTNRFRELTKEYSSVKEVAEEYKNYLDVLKEIEDNKSLLNDSDSDIRDMAKDEIETLEEKKEELIASLKLLLLPKDPNDSRNVILEIRAGTGGDESAIFTGDLFRMYSYFAQNRGWKIEIMSSSDSDMGGYKEIILNIKGDGAYSFFKYEAGVHRVQRVPQTESQGRIHTSACTVAVMPEAEEVDVDIEEKDLRIDVFRSSGPGGQSVNTTDSAVRVTHIPTGTVVICQDEKSQLKNKLKALKVLRSRLYEVKLKEQNDKIAADRKLQVGSGDRSERIRTYNFPQGRMTDHRIGLTLYRLEAIMQGDIEDIIVALRTHYQALAMSQDSGE